MSSALQNQAAWETSSLGFLQRQLFSYPKPIPPSLSLAGQTALVTGANGGLGLEALRQLLRLGISRGILAVRSRAKGDAAAAQLGKEFPTAQVDVMIVDMSSYDSIREFVGECGRLERLDTVILNAGVMSSRFETSTETGHDMTFQINYLSTILLSILLLPVLQAKKQPNQPARLSLVTSDTAYWAGLQTVGPVISQFDRKQNYEGTAAYANTKLALIAATMKLAEYISPDDIIVNTANPGLCSGTDISRNVEGFANRYLMPLLARTVGRSAKLGASTYIDGAVVQGKESHGSYTSDWAIKP